MRCLLCFIFDLLMTLLVKMLYSFTIKTKQLSCIPIYWKLWSSIGISWKRQQTLCIRSGVLYTHRCWTVVSVEIPALIDMLSSVCPVDFFCKLPNRYSKCGFINIGVEISRNYADHISCATVLSFAKGVTKLTCIYPKGDVKLVQNTMVIRRSKYSLFLPNFTLDLLPKRPTPGRVDD